MRSLRNDTSGFALIAVFMMIAVISSLFATYLVISRTELKSLKASKNSFSGFNAAEAGLNLRADIIKNEFVNYNRPAGTSPTDAAACAVPATAGTGDFACETYTLESGHEATTFVKEDATNPANIVIPLGEPFAGLTAAEYRFTVASVARNKKDDKEANLELVFKARLVPLFQFGIFFNDDLELVEGGTIYMGGPIHSNKDIYLAQQAAYWIPNPYSYFEGPMSATQTLFRGAKFQTSCTGGSGGWSGGWHYDIFVDDLSAYRELPDCSGSRFAIDDADLVDFNGNVLQNVFEVTVPSVNTFEAFAQPDPAQPNTFTYWDRSDVRFVLRLTAGGVPDTTNAATGIEVVASDGTLLTQATNHLNSATDCPGLHVTAGGAGRAVGAKGDWSGSYSSDDRLRLFRDYQHHSTIDRYETVLDVDMQALFNCMHNYSGDFFSSGGLDDSSDGGLVLFFAIDGPRSADAHNDYAVRLRNGAVLQSNVVGAPDVRGLTVVTDQKAVIWGDYNALDADWIPAAILSDSQYILSDVWTDAWSNTSQAWHNRWTGNTELRVQVAILSGAFPSCGGNGVTCTGSLNDFGGGYTGSFRFNETWYDGNRWGTSYTQQPFYWNGSLVSLDEPRHNDTPLGPFNYFSSPSYNFSYDTRFNDPDQLPPLTPRFVYNKQELFVREYE